MANIDQTTTQVITTERSQNLLEMPRAAIATIRDAIEQPGFRRAFPTLLATLTGIAAIGLFILMQTPNMTTLYASASESDKSKMFEALKNMGMDVELDPATGQVTIPTADYHQARISLAAQGLPEFAPDGYDAIDNLPLGASRSVETMKLKNVQESELARSIAEIRNVQAARVHLALPEKLSLIHI